MSIKNKKSGYYRDNKFDEFDNIAKNSFKNSYVENSNLSNNDNKEQKEFIKENNTLLKEDIKQQQRGGQKQFDYEIEEFEKNMKQLKKDKIKSEPTNNNRDNSDFDFEAAFKFEKEQKRMQDFTLNSAIQIQKGRYLRQLQQEKSIEHDLIQQSLGELSKIPGANVDYDEVKRLAKANIRDVGELVNESLANDGFTQDVDLIEQAMKNYMASGKPDINELVQLSKEYSPEAFAQAYVNTAKEANGHKDILKLTLIDEKVDFERPCYENCFDKIRSVDKIADKVLDKLDMEMGRER